MVGAHAIILAAGQSSRMGREKASLPWLDDQMLLEWSLGELLAAGWSATVVVRPENLLFWRTRLSQALVVSNPIPERGKMTSIAEGLCHIPTDSKWILLTAVDQPRPSRLYRLLLECAQIRNKKILVPDFCGHRGHPVVISGSLRDKLLAMTEADYGLRGLLDLHSDETYRMLDFDPNWLLWDLNFPSDYEKARAFFSTREEDGARL